MNYSTCRWPECDSTQIKGRHLCRKHYLKAWRAQDFDQPWLSLDRPPCKWPECATVPVERDYCSIHILRADRFPDSGEPWIPWALTPRSGVQRRAEHCIWPGCAEVSECRDFCYRHYGRAWTVGDYEAPWALWVQQCFVCGVEFCPLKMRRKTNAYCSSSCRSRAKWILHQDRERERNRNRYHLQRAAGVGEVVTTRALRDRDGDACYLCGIDIDFALQWPNAESPSLDHIRPISRGGAHSMKNTALTHLRCNVRKGAKVLPRGEAKCPDLLATT